MQQAGGQRIDSLHKGEQKGLSICLSLIKEAAIQMTSNSPG